ncbi:hypothetical protein A8H39_00035 [Paraburkholderia fungorum]|uniref:hypothetical protein n=1 Tax=Paraburkholderia fungorum TaxID=134537 RepID=UPI0004859E18|nr:hypothetical protein [Paraburkholderia fungorum]PNE59575.1 hypothetical protein A8H39_00035 [Paraburkholderia fungorum]
MNQQFVADIPKSSSLSQAQAAQLPIDLQMVVLDETRFYREDVQRLARKVFQVYAYDANRVTYCSEITPSYDLRAIETYALTASDLNAAKREEVYGMLNAEPHDSQYRHCKSVDGLSSLYRRPYHVFERDTDEDYDFQLETLLEHIRCDPPCIMPGRSDCIIV